VLLAAFDTATSTATCALVADGDVLGERTSSAVRVLAALDELLRDAGKSAHELGGIVVGTGPGSFTGVRIGVATARALAFALGVPLAGVSTLAALAAGAPGALPVVDAHRREVFTLIDGVPCVLAPADVRVEPGAVCVGDGARRYRSVFEAAGAAVPADDSALHVPRASLHASLARDFGAPEAIEPLYLRLPDAERAGGQAA
jgi:tRNA threonylcarbamoyladenosine biosynthesis protein TsaB